MDTKQSLSELIAQAITSSFPQVENLPSAGEIAGFLEIPPEKEMGDYAFPCFKLSRTLRMGPLTRVICARQSRWGATSTFS